MWDADSQPRHAALQLPLDGRSKCLLATLSVHNFAEYALACFVHLPQGPGPGNGPDRERPRSGKFLHSIRNSLARSVHAGALASCQELYLHLNQIGNEGMDSLAQSLKQGAMVSCRKLTTYSNPGNDLPVTKALKHRAEAAAAAEEQQAKVEKKVKKAAAA